jgi:hypothetical protein
VLARAFDCAKIALFRRERMMEQARVLKSVVDKE